MPHIADVARIENLVELYRPAFPSPEAAREFCQKVENLSPERSQPKTILHQAARMIWLADQTETLARGRPALQILFYLIAAELIAKLFSDFHGEGQSQIYVRRFFAEICSADHRKRLGTAFRNGARGFLFWERAVDVLYDIRCDVVHEGKYFVFNLPIEADDFPMPTKVGDDVLGANITIGEIRQIVLEGAVLGCQRLL